MSEKSYIELFQDTKFNGKDNQGIPKINYINQLRLMDLEKLSEETKKMIWLSAYASNNPKSDYHWQCDACYGVIEEKKLLGLYDKLHKQVVAECGY